MNLYAPFLDSIDTQSLQMTNFLEKWTDINSGTMNLGGLSEMMQELKVAFKVLGGEMKEISLPPVSYVMLDGSLKFNPLGKALSITKRLHAPKKVLLGGHMDIVQPSDRPFEKCQRLDFNILKGRGAADMKGGLVILLFALKCLENSPFAEKIGWEILINPDEEIGSPSSAPLFKKPQTDIISE